MSSRENDLLLVCGITGEYVNLHDIFCTKDASELQKLSSLNGIMGLLGSEQELLLVS